MDFLWGFWGVEVRWGYAFNAKTHPKLGESETQREFIMSGITFRTHPKLGESKTGASFTSMFGMKTMPSMNTFSTGSLKTQLPLTRKPEVGI